MRVSINKDRNFGIRTRAQLHSLANSRCSRNSGKTQKSRRLTRRQEEVKKKSRRLLRRQEVIKKLRRLTRNKKLRRTRRLARNKTKLEKTYKKQEARTRNQEEASLLVKPWPCSSCGMLTSVIFVSRSVSWVYVCVYGSAAHC